MVFTSPIPEGALYIEGCYIWDNTVVEYQDKLFRYALSADRNLDIAQRHEHARLRLAISEDGGKSWMNKSEIFQLRQGIWPDHVIWTSTANVRQTPDGDEFVLLITGRSTGDGRIQKIGLATSRDGQNFGHPVVVLDPLSQPAAELGYDVIDVDQEDVIMAWRDPFLFCDPNDQRWHLFFAAKPIRSTKMNPIGTVGHAVAMDDTLKQWDLQAPLELPLKYAQVEVPAVVYRDGEYFLFVSTQDHPLRQTNKEKGAAFRGYRSKAIRGPWNPIYGSKDRIFGDEVYGTTLFQRGAETWGVAFYSEDSDWPIIGTPMAPMVWRQRNPSLTFEIP